jgi:hypothetical protein
VKFAWPWIRLACVVAFAATFQGSSCVQPVIQPTVDQVTQSFNNALTSLGSQSADWRSTLQILENNLAQQAQQTLANQVQSLIDRGAAFTLNQGLCDVQFLASQLASRRRSATPRP